VQGIHSRDSGIASALIGATLVLAGAFLPWIQPESQLIGRYATHQRGLSLGALGSSEWRLAFIGLALVGMVAACRCAGSDLARRMLPLIGGLIIAATAGVYRSHGYSVSDGSWGPVLTILGGLT
jgi:hypothetical protein